MNHSVRNSIIVIGVFALFLSYSFSIYTSATTIPSEKLANEKALQGRQVWQDYNCIACHQIYGLGGYMGPDLTNVISKKGKAYVKAVLQNGLGRMPDLNMKEKEINALVQYLEVVDKSGKFPNGKYDVKWYGAVDIPEE